jgi:hypothetical protein
MKKEMMVTTENIAKAKRGLPCLKLAITGKKVETTPITIH